MVSFFCFISLFILFLIIFCVLKSWYRNYKFSHQNYITDKTTVLITGGCMGIGHEVIKKLISCYNCSIINIDVRRDLFPELEKEFENSKKLKNIYGDLSQKNIVLADLLTLNDVDIQSIDILINNAGIAYNYPLSKLTTDQIKKTLYINLVSPLCFIKEIISHKSESKHLHIVTMASVLSHIIAKNSSDYVSTKWGLYGFHESVRAEYLGRKDLSFTIFCPYAVNTGMFPGFRNPIPFLFKIFNPEEIGREIVKSIILKEKVVYFPFVAKFVCGLYHLLPCWFGDLLQYTFCKFYLI